MVGHPGRHACPAVLNPPCRSNSPAQLLQSALRQLAKRTHSSEHRLLFLEYFENHISQPARHVCQLWRGTHAHATGCDSSTIRPRVTSSPNLTADWPAVFAGLKPLHPDHLQQSVLSMNMSEVEHSNPTPTREPTPIVHSATGSDKYVNYGENIAIIFMSVLIVATAIFVLWRLALMRWTRPQAPRFAPKDSESEAESRAITESDAEEGDDGGCRQFAYRHGSLKRQDTLDFDETEDSRMCGQFTPQSFITH